jgi:hypothetical protein
MVLSELKIGKKSRGGTYIYSRGDWGPWGLDWPTAIPRPGNDLRVAIGNGSRMTGLRALDNRVDHSPFYAPSPLIPSLDSGTGEFSMSEATAASDCGLTGVEGSG